MEFVESDDYLIEVNVTAENTDQLSRLQYNYTTHNGAILLQLVSKIIFISIRLS